MLSCPMCRKQVDATARNCPRCATDLSLLTDFLSHRSQGLEWAEALARRGQLGEAVWAYLEVLDVDPDEPTARRQVGQVVTAVRQFDRASRRRWRHWERGLGLPFARPDRLRWWGFALALVLALAGAMALGYYLGCHAGLYS